MTYLRMALIPCGLLVAWLTLRCRLGFHGETDMERTDAGVVEWRCRRCWKVAGRTHLPQSAALRFLTHGQTQAKVVDFNKAAAAPMAVARRRRRRSDG